MKRLIILSILILAGFLTSCEKQGTGKVTFYTNAQAVLNCGSFNVEVYINKTLVGTIKKPFLPLGESPECNSSNSDSLLVVEKPEGNYEYTARLTCSDSLKYVGTFQVKKNSCTLVYIDVSKSK